MRHEEVPVIDVVECDLNGRGPFFVGNMDVLLIDPHTRRKAIPEILAGISAWEGPETTRAQIWAAIRRVLRMSRVIGAEANGTKAMLDDFGECPNNYSKAIDTLFLNTSAGAVQVKPGLYRWEFLGLMVIAGDIGGHGHVFYRAYGVLVIDTSTPELPLPPGVRGVFELKPPELAAYAAECRGRGLAGPLGPITQRICGGQSAIMAPVRHYPRGFRRRRHAW